MIASELLMNDVFEHDKIELQTIIKKKYGMALLGFIVITLVNKVSNVQECDATAA